MTRVLLYIPLLGGTLIVFATVIASGGSLIQSGVAGIATGASGFFTSLLVSQSQISKQKLLEEELESLSLGLENQKQLLVSKDDLEHWQSLQESFQQHIHELKHFLELENPKFLLAFEDKLNHWQSLQESFQQSIHDLKNFLELENPKFLLPFEGELKHCQSLQESLQHEINELKHHRYSIESIAQDKFVKTPVDSYNSSNSEFITKKKERSCIQEYLQGNYEVIINFLESRGIKVKNIPTEDITDDTINRLSRFLGENYEGLHDLLARIKRNMQQGYPFTLSLKEYTQKDRNDVCQFCTDLHEIAFLEEYRYLKSPHYLLRARPTSLPAAQNFFSGKWLERFVLLTVQKCIGELHSDLQKTFAYLLNPQVILPNGHDFEIDLICHVNGSFLWIEAKSGDYQQHINKYSKISRILNLNSKHSIMVLPDISGGTSETLTSLFSMTVCPLSHLEELITETIRVQQVG